MHISIYGCHCELLSSSKKTDNPSIKPNDPKYQILSQKDWVSSSRFSKMKFVRKWNDGTSDSHEVGEN